MIAATIASGHSLPVPNAPIAASNTATLPGTSLRALLRICPVRLP
jgi:hypothetical protein